MCSPRGDWYAPRVFFVRAESQLPAFRRSCPIRRCSAVLGCHPARHGGNPGYSQDHRRRRERERGTRAYARAHFSLLFSLALFHVHSLPPSFFLSLTHSLSLSPCFFHFSSLRLSRAVRENRRGTERERGRWITRGAKEREKRRGRRVSWPNTRRSTKDFDAFLGWGLDRAGRRGGGLEHASAVRPATTPRAIPKQQGDAANLLRPNGKAFRLLLLIPLFQCRSSLVTYPASLRLLVIAQSFCSGKNVPENVSALCNSISSSASPRFCFPVITAKLNVYASAGTVKILRLSSPITVTIDKLILFAITSGCPTTHEQFLREREQFLLCCTVH